MRLVGESGNVAGNTARPYMGDAYGDLISKNKDLISNTRSKPLQCTFHYSVSSTPASFTLGSSCYTNPQQVPHPIRTIKVHMLSWAAVERPCPVISGSVRATCLPLREPEEVMVC